jgi:hypothetical protein
VLLCVCSNSKTQKQEDYFEMVMPPPTSVHVAPHGSNYYSCYKDTFKLFFVLFFIFISILNSLNQYFGHFAPFVGVN